jgi:hypothetical protein
MQQHYMRVPLFNDYGPLPAQQAAAAAQHPMLAPRPIDAATMGYHNFPPSDSAPSAPSQTINAPQFYYPALPVQVPQPWPTQPGEQDGPGPIPSTTIGYSRFETQPTSDQDNFQHKQGEYKQEADAQYPQPITNWAKANLPGQGFASSSVPPNTGDAVWDKTGSSYPQVCVIVPNLLLKITSLRVYSDKPPSWPHIPLPAAT